MFNDDGQPSPKHMCMVGCVLDVTKLREEIQETSRFGECGTFQMDIEVPGDNQLAIVCGEDLHKGRKLGGSGEERDG